MNKEEIMNDIKFRQVCNKFGLDWSDFEVFKNLIVLKTPVNNLYVFLDTNYNIVEIEKCTLELNDETCEQMSFNYENLIDFIQDGDHIQYPFNEFTLKQINDIANRVNVRENNHGHSSKIEINGQWYKDSKNDFYIELIHYIKFINEEMNLYWENIYPLKVLEFDVPDIYSYLESIIYKIKTCVINSINNSRRPHPVDIMNYIGQNIVYQQNPVKYNSLLYSVIDLLMKEENMKAVPGTIHEIKPISSNEMIPPLDSLAEDILKILEISDEQVIENRKEYSDNQCKQKIKSIQEWLSEDIDN